MSKEKFRYLKKIAEGFKSLRLSFSALVRTTSFKVALSFAGLFTGFSIVLLGFIYFSTVFLLSYDADKSARRELSELSDIWQQKGINSLNAAVIERATFSMENLYVLITPEGKVLSGNIDTVPMDLSKVKRPIAGEYLKDVPVYSAAFTYFRADTNNQTRGARGVFIAGSDGYGLFVAHDLGTGFVLADRIVKLVWFGSIAVLGLSVWGGLFAARRATKRVDELSQTARFVMAGELNRRAKTREIKPNEGDEFDNLTTDLNAMLDRIEKLVQSSRSIGDTIAHDLRSPLTRIRAKLEEANSRDLSKEDLQDEIDKSIADIDSVVHTFNAVLRLSRLEAGEGANYQVFNLSETLEEICELYEPSILDKNIEFESFISPDININADRPLIVQAIINIIDNAIKYSDKGKISISLKKNKAKNTIIEIIDTGMGIAIEDRKKVLERFVRLDKARTTQGNGIGLSLSNAVIEAHNGTIELTDGFAHETGHGLKIILNLPTNMPN